MPQPSLAGTNRPPSHPHDPLAQPPRERIAPNPHDPSSPRAPRSPHRRGAGIPHLRYNFPASSRRPRASTPSSRTAATPTSGAETLPPPAPPWCRLPAPHLRRLLQPIPRRIRRPPFPVVVARFQLPVENLAVLPLDLWWPRDPDRAPPKFRSYTSNNQNSWNA